MFSFTVDGRRWVLAAESEVGYIVMAYRVMAYIVMDGVECWKQSPRLRLWITDVRLSAILAACAKRRAMLVACRCNLLADMQHVTRAGRAVKVDGFPRDNL